MLSVRAPKPEQMKSASEDRGVSEFVIRQLYYVRVSSPAEMPKKLSETHDFVPENKTVAWLTTVINDLPQDANVNSIQSCKTKTDKTEQVD